jgi:predicted PurR-regulated permease PerM
MKAAPAAPAPAPAHEPMPGARHPFWWLATIALVVTIFARAQEVLVPLALAVVIAFAMNPAVTLIERRLGRGLAVALVVLVGLASVSGFGLLLRYQLFDLTAQMNRYSESMRHKVASLRGQDAGGLGALSRTFDRVLGELDRNVTETEQARPVRVVPAEATALERVGAVVEPVVKPAAKAVIVLVLVLFLLARREDLRDRLIRLLGRRNVSLTTRTLDEAGRRIGRYLVVQSFINGGFGLMVALGLFVIGVPYPLLWGFVVAVLRFVPLVGTLLGMLPPVLLAFAQLPGWWYALGTAGLFLGLDIGVAYFVEPMAIGRKTGVSSIAMVVSAIFWTWLWGPVGLVLSTPLTVCLAVLGRQVSRLEVLAVLLGDEPALEAEIALYQRLLARDEDEAAAILDRHLRAAPSAEVLDDIAVPVLVAAAHDRAHGTLGVADEQDLLRTLRALLANARPDPPGAIDGELGRAGLGRVLGVPSRNAAEELVWEMLAHALDPARIELESVGAEALASEVVERATQMKRPSLVCITSFPPGGLAQVKYLCKKLRAARADLLVLVVRVGVPVELRLPALSLLEEGASAVAFTLADAQAAIERLLGSAPRVPAAPASPLLDAIPAAHR